MAWGKIRYIFLMCRDTLSHDISGVLGNTSEGDISGVIEGINVQDRI